MTHLTKTLGYRDCWRASHLQCDGDVREGIEGLVWTGTDYCSSEAGEETRTKNPRPPRRLLCFDSAPASTCRFDTRIDWIMLPPIEHCDNLASTKGERIKINMDVVCHCSSGYYVVDSLLSDHKLVVANIDLSASKK
jgi:hypothetical protein